MNDYYDKDYETSYKKPKKKSKKISTRLLTIIQITVCSIIVVTAIFVRLFGGNAYSVIKNWYLQNINNSIVADEQIQDVKHSVVELLPWTSNLAPSASSQQPESSQQGLSSQSASSAQQTTDSSQGKG